jgi:hypothetical protein
MNTSRKRETIGQWVLAAITGTSCCAWAFLSPTFRVLIAAALGCSFGLLLSLAMAPAWRARGPLRRPTQFVVAGLLVLLSPVTPMAIAAALRLPWLLTLLANTCTMAIASALVVTWKAGRNID